MGQSAPPVPSDVATAVASLDSSELPAAPVPAPSAADMAMVARVVEIPEVDKLKPRIIEDSFIDFRDLLAPTPTPTHYTWNPATGTQVHFVPKPKTPLTLKEWARAFLIYKKAYCSAHPECADNMDAYMHFILELEHDGGDWRGYDEGFRKKRATVKTPWNLFHNVLYATVYGGYKKHQPFREGPRSSGPNKFGGSIPTGYCFAYNEKGSGCGRKSCQYKHLCFKCDQQHPGFQHRKDSKSANKGN